MNIKLSPSCSDPNSPHFCDIHHQGEDSKVHPQCSGGVNSGWHPHLYLLDLQRRHLQGHDQVMEEGDSKEQSCQPGEYESWTQNLGKIAIIYTFFYKESIKMSSKATDSSQVCFKMKETNNELKGLASTLQGFQQVQKMILVHICYKNLYLFVGIL